MILKTLLFIAIIPFILITLFLNRKNWNTEDGDWKSDREDYLDGK